MPLAYCPLIVPPTDYWDHRVTQLEVTATRQLWQTGDGSKCSGMVALGDADGAVSDGRAPTAEIRNQLGLAWDGADSMREARLWRLLTPYPRLPTVLRYTAIRDDRASRISAAGSFPNLLSNHRVPVRKHISSHNP